MKIPDFSSTKRELQLATLSSRLSKSTNDYPDSYSARDYRNLSHDNETAQASVFLTHASWVPETSLSTEPRKSEPKKSTGYQMPSFLQPLNEAHNEYFQPLPASLQTEASKLSVHYTSAELAGALFRVADIHAHLRLRGLAHARVMADYLGKTEPLEVFIRRGVKRGTRVRRLFNLLHRLVHQQKQCEARIFFDAIKALVGTIRIVRIPVMIYEEEFFEFGFDPSLSEIEGSPVRYKNSQGRTIEFHPGGSRFLDDYSEINQSTAKLNLLSSNHDFRVLEEKKLRRGSEGQPEIIEEKYKADKPGSKQTQKQIKDAKIKEIRSKVKPKEILDPAYNKYADPASPQKTSISRSGEYLSYWLRCIEHALGAPDIFQMESIGYIAVFKTAFEPTDKEISAFV